MSPLSDTTPTLGHVWGKKTWITRLFTRCFLVQRARPLVGFCGEHARLCGEQSQFDLSLTQIGQAHPPSSVGGEQFAIAIRVSSPAFLRVSPALRRRIRALKRDSLLTPPHPPQIVVKTRERDASVARDKSGNNAGQRRPLYVTGCPTMDPGVRLYALRRQSPITARKKSRQMTNIN